MNTGSQPQQTNNCCKCHCHKLAIRKKKTNITNLFLNNLESNSRIEFILNFRSSIPV